MLIESCFSLLGGEDDKKDTESKKVAVSESESEKEQTETEDTYEMKNEKVIDKDIEKETNIVPKLYKKALKKAKAYAEKIDMSKAGIYQQLISEYGEDFPEDASLYAIETLEWDYKESALRKAQLYQDKMNMSLSEIYDQLTSEYGENFTPEEAQYAIDHLED